MKQRLLDIIACPNDSHFPLELRVDATEEGVVTDVVCETYCARFNVFLEQSPVAPADCRDCSALDVVSGELYCPTCQNVFKIEEGTPVLLAEQSLGDNEVGREKANEMRARDDQAAFYDKFMRLRLWSRYEAPKMVALLDAGADDLLIELGSGTGRLTKLVAGLVSEVVAVDFSMESLRRSRVKCRDNNIHWIKADINYLPFRDCVADRILSSQVFEHLPGAAMRNKAVDEAARIIRGTGTFTISVYRDSWLWRLSGAKEGYHGGGIYYCRLSGDEFSELLGRQFEIKKHIPNLGFYLQAARCIKTRP